MLEGVKDRAYRWMDAHRHQVGRMGLLVRFLWWLEGKLDVLYDRLFGEDEETESPKEEQQEESSPYAQSGMV